MAFLIDLYGSTEEEISLEVEGFSDQNDPKIVRK